MTYESTCPRCGAMLTSGGCLSCGYPAGSLRERTAADTVLAEKSKGDTPLGHVRIEALIESFENLAYVRQQLADAEGKHGERIGFVVRQRDEAKHQLEEAKCECRILRDERDEAISRWSSRAFKAEADLDEARRELKERVAERNVECDRLQRYLNLAAQERDEARRELALLSNAVNEFDDSPDSEWWELPAIRRALERGK